MKNKYVFYVCVFFVLSLLVIMFIQKNKEIVNDKQSKMIDNQLEKLQKQIEKIESEVVDLTASNDLKSIAEFNAMLNANKKKVEIASICKFLGDNSKSIVHKEILIYSLNNIKIDNYIDVFECCLSLYENKIIDDNLLITILYPGKDWNCLLIKNYENKRLRKLLEENINKVTNELAEVFNLILSGVMWMSIEEERSL